MISQLIAIFGAALIGCGVIIGLGAPIAWLIGKVVDE